MKAALYLADGRRFEETTEPDARPVDAFVRSVPIEGGGSRVVVFWRVDDVDGVAVYREVQE